MQAQVSLQERKWIYRRWELALGGRRHVIEYDGRGAGFETVLVDGDVAARVKSWSWFVPRFDFEIDGLPMTLHVRVDPLFRLQSVALVQGETRLYEEGRPIVATRPVAPNDTSNLVDEGFCLFYYQLSYRRRIIRSLWCLPFCLLFLAFPILIGLPWPWAWTIFWITVVGSLLQALWNYLLFKREP